MIWKVRDRNEIKKRMSSFVKSGNELIKIGRISESMKLIERGLEYYTKNITNAIYPYAKEDAGLIVFVLRHLADEVERNNPGAKELFEGMKKCVRTPSIIEIEKVKSK